MDIGMRWAKPGNQDRHDSRWSRSWGRPRRVQALAALSAAAVITTLAGVSPASAVITTTGPVEPSGNAAGLPAWYADDTGLALQPCLDSAPNCLAAASD